MRGAAREFPADTGGPLRDHRAINALERPCKVKPKFKAAEFKADPRPYR
jgi:hypothetical protein